MEHNELVADRYLLDQPVASGTMGEVWRATDTRLDRPVAVKVLRADLPDGEAARARFAAEATVVSALFAPQLATVYDHGEAADGDTVRPYLVMEWVDGRPLSALLAETGRLSAEDTVRIVTETAAALHIAHEAGVVHRDVKPGNILITAAGGVKLIDFGIATARGESGRDETGRIVGTPAYLSPEQITNWKLTPGADVYGLGIVAYECLAGAPPFDSDNATKVLADHLTKPPGPLPAHVPEPLAAVIGKALRKRAANRWTTVAEFATALHEALPAEATPAPAAAPVSAAPVPATRRAAKTAPRSPGRSGEPAARPPRRRRTLAVQLTALAGVVVLLAVAALLLLPTPEPAPDNRRAADAEDVQDPAADGDGSGSTESEEDSEDNEPKTDKKPGDPETASESKSPEDDDSEGGDDGDNGSDGTVPDLKGTQTYAVSYELSRHGYENSAGKAQSEQDGKQNCVVTGQYPEAGTKASPSTTIVYYYRAPSYGCATGSRVTAIDDHTARPPAALTRPSARRRIG